MAMIAQELLVALIVVGCTAFSAWRLMSPRLRLRALDLVAPVAMRLGAGNAVSRVRSRVTGQLAAGCSTCSHNKSAVHRPGTRRATGP